MLLHTCILENIEFEGTAPPILCADLYGIVPPLKIYQIHNVVNLRNRPWIISGNGTTCTYLLSGQMFSLTNGYKYKLLNVPICVQRARQGRL